MLKVAGSISTNGSCAKVADNFSRGSERERRRDNFVARSNAQREKREMQCAGTVGYCERVACADIRSKFAFEALYFGPCRDPSGAQRVEDFAFLVGTDRRAMKGDLTHYLPGQAANWRSVYRIIHETYPSRARRLESAGRSSTVLTAPLRLLRKSPP